MKSLLFTALSAILFVSCGSPTAPALKEKPKTPVVKAKPKVKPKPVKQVLPPAPPSTHVDKVVEDDNYQEQYMYPEDGNKAKKDPVSKVEKPTTDISKTENMTKEACVGMIGQEKFDKYSTMFGSEEASIKRCAMMKSMQE